MIRPSSLCLRAETNTDVLQEMPQIDHQDQRQEAVRGALQDVSRHWQDQQLLSEDFSHSNPWHHDDVQVQD